MNLYATTCQDLHLGCFSSGNHLLADLGGVPNAYECQVACANTPTCILTQYGHTSADSEYYYCNLFSSDFADTYDPGSEITYPCYCDLFAFYTFDTCPVTVTAPS